MKKLDKVIKKFVKNHNDGGNLLDRVKYHVLIQEVFIICCDDEHLKEMELKKPFTTYDFVNWMGQWDNDYVLEYDSNIKSVIQIIDELYADDLAELNERIVKVYQAERTWPRLI